jgi:hypothetical protein
MSRIAYFVPAYNEQISTGLAFQLVTDTNAARMAGHDVLPFSRHSCDLVFSRNAALIQTLQSGFDYLFMVDADVFCDGALLPLLSTLETSGAHAVTAIVPLRTVTEGQHVKVSSSRCIRPRMKTRSAVPWRR